VAEKDDISDRIYWNFAGAGSIAVHFRNHCVGGDFNSVSLFAGQYSECVARNE
jgi:hypothetical protein